MKKAWTEEELNVKIPEHLVFHGKVYGWHLLWNPEQSRWHLTKDLNAIDTKIGFWNLPAILKLKLY